ncbi:hypothetical protein ACFYO1_11750 [Nocardia sp. NPDC006044]|uniref:hypothetical protein n=1 Tax=Nocardia sp. NPDC006044 TaxID=3364306 RepID=UPI0036971F31
MAQPEFRRRITERAARLPRPIPALWSLVDGLHYTADAGLTLLEEIHSRLHRNAIRMAGPRLGLSSERIGAYLQWHDRATTRVYGAARAAHWYL